MTVANMGRSSSLKFAAGVAAAFLAFSALAHASTGPDDSTLLGEGTARGLTPPEIEAQLQVYFSSSAVRETYTDSGYVGMSPGAVPEC